MVWKIIQVITLDRTIWLIGSGLFNQRSCPVRAKVECCKSCDPLSGLVTDSWTARILFLSIMDTTYGQQVASMRRVSYPSAEVESMYSIATGYMVVSEFLLLEIFVVFFSSLVIPILTDLVLATEFYASAFVFYWTITDVLICSNL